MARFRLSKSAWIEDGVLHANLLKAQTLPRVGEVTSTPFTSGWWDVSVNGVYFLTMTTEERDQFVDYYKEFAPHQLALIGG